MGPLVWSPHLELNRTPNQSMLIDWTDTRVVVVDSDSNSFHDLCTPKRSTVQKLMGCGAALSVTTAEQPEKSCDVRFSSTPSELSSTRPGSAYQISRGGPKITDWAHTKVGFKT